MIRRQKTLLILLGPLSLMVRAAYATLPVVDYSHIAQDAGNEIVNFAKWAKTEVDQAQTAINTASQRSQNFTRCTVNCRAQSLQPRCL